MKNIAIIFLIALLGLPMQIGDKADITANPSDMILVKPDGTILIDASIENQNDYLMINGFEITYILQEGGKLGDDFVLNALMIASGAKNADSFTMDFNGSLPKYIGTAEEIITHCTGNSFVGPMLFGNGIDADKDKVTADQLSVGESATVKYEGDDPLFDTTNRFLTACIAFGMFADFYVENGTGRYISTEEAISQVNRADLEGNVVEVLNSKDVEMMCSCCGCCCGVMKALILFGGPAADLCSNYLAEYDSSRCSHCKKCLERCSIGAINEQDGHIRIDADKCIGCGLCVTTCPSAALRLFKKTDDKVYLPEQKTILELYDHLSTLRNNKSIHDMNI